MMLGEDKPKNTVVPYSKQRKINRFTDAFVAPEGSWKRLVIAKNNLIQLMDPLTKQGAPAYAGLTLEQSTEVLVGYCGLRGEFGNAIETMVQAYLDPEKAEEVGLVKISPYTFNARIAKVVAAFASNSQLCSPGEDRIAIARKIDGISRNMRGYPTETKLEALHRCGAGVENWLAVNHDQPADVRAAIYENLDNYRVALREVDAYVAYASEYVKRREETHRSKSNHLGA